jgi:hypothetical protein
LIGQCNPGTHSWMEATRQQSSSWNVKLSTTTSSRKRTLRPSLISALARAVFAFKLQGSHSSGPMESKCTLASGSLHSTVWNFSTILTQTKLHSSCCQTQSISRMVMQGLILTSPSHFKMEGQRHTTRTSTPSVFALRKSSSTSWHLAWTWLISEFWFGPKMSKKLRRWAWSMWSVWVNFNLLTEERHLKPRRQGAWCMPTWSFHQYRNLLAHSQVGWLLLMPMLSRWLGPYEASLGRESVVYI